VLDLDRLGILHRESIRRCRGEKCLCGSKSALGEASRGANRLVIIRYRPRVDHRYPVPSKTDRGRPHDPAPVGTDAANDGFALVPIELSWRLVGGIAYNNLTTGVKITRFPAIHCRQGSIGYKLEWNGLTMIYSSDTRPETNCLNQANNPDPVTGVPRGVDVLIQEMIFPPELLAMKNLGLTYPPASGTNTRFDDGVSALSDISVIVG
jgi:hypothetical protein